MQLLPLDLFRQLLKLRSSQHIAILLDVQAANLVTGQALQSTRALLRLHGSGQAAGLPGEIQLSNSTCEKDRTYEQRELSQTSFRNAGCSAFCCDQDPAAVHSKVT